jgi:hypothetical protein
MTKKQAAEPVYGRSRYQPAKLELTPPVRYCNSMQPAMTEQDVANLPKPYIRPGADHSHLKSKGGC